MFEWCLCRVVGGRECLESRCLGLLKDHCRCLPCIRYAFCHFDLSAPVPESVPPPAFEMPA